MEPEADFSIYNLPYGIFRTDQRTARLATAIGDQVVDLLALQELGLFDGQGLKAAYFEQPSLNAFMASSQSEQRAVRDRLNWLLDATESNHAYRAQADRWLLPLSKVELLLPVEIPDYTDFYSSREHAQNVGSLFRDPANALPPNWLHLPIGYHGRSSSIVASGTPIRRPYGQRLEGTEVVFGPSQRLDYELEMAAVVAWGNPLGAPIPVDEAEDYIFGLALFNDWSARDIQRWEYQPLGPFLGKNFASSLGHWIVPLDALTPFRVPAPEQKPSPLPYLRQLEPQSFDIHLTITLKTAAGHHKQLARTNYRYLYWTIAQQLAHHTVNGCNLRCGDLMASGTISGPEATSVGSLLEQSSNGRQPVDLGNGETRCFLEDGDTVQLHAYCQGDGYRVGFGTVEGTITASQTN